MGVHGFQDIRPRGAYPVAFPLLQHVSDKIVFSIDPAFLTVKIVVHGLDHPATVVVVSSHGQPGVCSQYPCFCTGNASGNVGVIRLGVTWRRDERQYRDVRVGRVRIIPCILEGSTGSGGGVVLAGGGGCLQGGVGGCRR